MATSYKNRRLWVLGGNDGEMETIKMLLGMAGETWDQPSKGWGDHSYSELTLGFRKITSGDRNNWAFDTYGRRDVPVYKMLRGLKTVLFVECRPTPEEKPLTKRLVLDHHGERAGEPAVVLQVFKILERSGLRISNEMRRWIEVVAANDCGAYEGLETVGATADEIIRVRALDRKAQGITAEQETEANRAVKTAETFGKTRVVIMAHNKCAPVVDRLHEMGYRGNVLIIGGEEANFFGDGGISATLAKTFNDSWSGGAGLGVAGDMRSYWGRKTQDIAASSVLEIFLEVINH